jgi:hypothetical protein
LAFISFKASNADLYKEKYEKLQSEFKLLKDYKKKCENLEIELNQVTKKLCEEIESNKIKNENKLKSIQYQNFEQENKILKERSSEYEKKLKENEKDIENLKNKEAIIEKLNKSLELELNELKVMNVNSELQQHKLNAIEHANRILEQELDSFKKKYENDVKKFSGVVNQLKTKLRSFEDIEEQNKQLTNNLNNHQQSNQIIEMKLRQENELLKADIEHLIEYETQCKIIETKLFEFEQEIHKLKKINEVLENENINLKSLNSNAEKDFVEKMKVFKYKENDYENLQSLKENELARKNEILNSIEIENENLNNALKIRNEEILCLKDELNNLNANYENELNELRNKQVRLLDEMINLKQTLDEERAEFQKIKDIQLNEYEIINKKYNNQVSKNEDILKNCEDLNFELNEYKIKCEKISKDYENLLKIETNRINTAHNDKIKENYEQLQIINKNLNDKFLIMVSQY